MSQRGTAIPDPRIYRGALREAFAASEAGRPGQRDDLITRILGGERAERVVLSNTHFFGTKWAGIAEGSFYPQAGPRMAQLCEIFRGDQVELFMCIQNPGIFIPKTLNALPETRRNKILGTTDLSALSWSRMVEQVLQMAPQAKITLWCNEDAPMIWGRILRALAGLTPGEPVRGQYSLLAEILTEDGRRELSARVSRNPERDEADTQELVADILQRHADRDKIEEELDFPGWSNEVIDAFTELYENDVAKMRAMPGVTFLAPGD
ncbi:hypothetical protein [Ruegeria marisrubri]|uniref:hypothetical protein n=1 Tax=Ruegeria marisrubri TaxID=1685379 RepID=UPI0012FD2827|nr:hypothetical protein [Ruegeria marisrubri]